MFTRQAPQLHTALWLGGLSPAMASQVQNLLGQCRQQIEHRGPISVNNTLPEPRKVTPEQAKAGVTVISQSSTTNVGAFLPEEQPPIPPEITQYINNIYPPGGGGPGPVIVIKGEKGDPGADGKDGLDGRDGKDYYTPKLTELTVLTSVSMESGQIVFKTKQIKALVLEDGEDQTLPTTRCEDYGTSP